MKKNLPLIIGLAIPVLMIIFVAVAIYAPSIFAHPKYDFVFSAGDTYYTDYGDHYSVAVGKISKTTISQPIDSFGKPYPTTRVVELFRYDAKADNVHPITFEDAQKLNLDVSPKSPDGYVLTHGNNNNGIFELFGSNRDYNAWFLKKGIVSKKIYIGINQDGYYYDSNSQFLGWVVGDNTNNK